MIRALFKRKKKERRPLSAELAIAQVHMKTVEAGVRSAFGLDRPGDWLVELDHGRITWTFDSGEKLVAHAELVGTWAENSQSFMWAWANPNVAGDTNSAALAVRKFGQENGYKELEDGTYSCDLTQSLGLAGLALIHSDLNCVLEQDAQPGLIAFLGLKMPKMEVTH